jgi:hypothetical protein
MPAAVLSYLRDRPSATDDELMAVAFGGRDAEATARAIHEAIEQRLGELGLSEQECSIE